MPRNTRQKKRAERRELFAGKVAADDAKVDKMTSTNEEAVEVVAVPASDEYGKENKANDSEPDENAMGDGNNCDANGASNVSDNQGIAATAAGAQKKMKNASRANPILVVLKNAMLHLSDSQLLNGPHFLNDALIGFYMAYLDEIKYQSNGDFMFVTPELSQSLPYMDKLQLETALVEERNACRKSFIFIAVNDGDGPSKERKGGVYWSLLVASRSDKCFYHFASYGGNNTENAMELFNTIKDVVDMRQARFRIMRCLQHKNDYDCGVHVMCMVDHVADYVNRYDSVEGVSQLSPDVIMAKRGRFIRLITSLDPQTKYK
ncbi:sentrin-specific protease 8 [Drosophila grimshawi]|uniref:GH24159 n=1 Tax=Drosophila grimshawi TaxID=7222 RepID=B4JND5_DROGR|nr:sentrin-specific protease 8 [Drosophila grimshawi]EDV92228.1 GH24159 [Drosophila grimshawi]